MITDPAQPAPHQPILSDDQARPRLTAGARLQTDRLTGQPVLLFPEGMLKLNSAGAAIIELCDGARSIAEVRASLAARFSVPADVLRTDVAEYLARLLRRGLVQILPAPATEEARGGPTA